MDTQKRSRYTKESLLEAAIQITNEKGYDNVTVDQLCEELGVTKGSFYHHFKSKTDLIFQRYKLLEGQISDYYNQRIYLPPDQQLRAMFDWYNRYFCDENVNEARMIVQFSIEKKWKNFGINNTFQKRVMTNIIRRGVEENLFCKNLDPVDTTEFIFINFYGILVQWISTPDKFKFDKNFDHFYYNYLLPLLGVKQ
jgi:AcrR family transcriptional regulator